MTDKALTGRNYQTLIFECRGTKVMLDADLAALYGIQTKALKQQVKRNIKRFPPDFMFELTKEEFEILRSQIVTPSWGGSRYLPMAFTEQGIAMLSSVINSEKAIQINIEIMRAFSRYRAMLIATKELREEILELDQKLNQAFRFLLDKIDNLHQKSADREPIGYKINKKK
jgi:phage regulator Rha-like protein